MVKYFLTEKISDSIHKSHGFATFVLIPLLLALLLLIATTILPGLLDQLPPITEAPVTLSPTEIVQVSPTHIIGPSPTVTVVPTGPTATATIGPTISPTGPTPTISVSQPTPTTLPTIAPTSGPAPTLPPLSGNFPCGRYPNASPGCMPVSYQSWFDNVPATAETMSVNYTPRLLHHHYECNVPAARTNGQYPRQAINIPCLFVRYNSIIPFSESGNSGWYRSCNQGSCYERHDLGLSPCQGGKYEGKECRSEHVHNVRSSDMSSNTEMRFSPNANFVGMDGTRHFISANWQTGIGYRSSSEFTTRYWQGLCGGYQRVILKNVDKYYTGNEPIPTVRGTVSIPFTTNGGCGTQIKTLVFLDPTQHVVHGGQQGGVTLMEQNGHFSGNLTWDTTKTSNGVHSLLFINLEGTNRYVSAAGVAVRYNVQN